MELLIISDALRRSSASRITAVIPLFRLRPPRPSIKGPHTDHRQLVANMLVESGIERILTLDLPRDTDPRLFRHSSG